MHSLTRPIVGLSLLASLAGSAAAAYAAIAPCPSGRYRIDGAPLDLGAGASGIPGVDLRIRRPFGGGPPQLLVSLAGSCDTVQAVQIDRDDKFVTRAKFTGCGDLAAFRLRLAFSADCETVVGRVKAAGQLVARFDATRSGDVANPSPDDPTVPPTPSPESPELTVFAPLAAAPGDTISIFGQNLDRGSDGERWIGTTDTPPYIVRFGRPRFGSAVDADFVFLGDNELRVTVPQRVSSGEIRLFARNLDGSAGELISQTLERFIVTDDDTTPVPPPVSAPVPPSTNTGTLVVQGTEQNALNPGTYAVSGAANQVGAFLDEEGNHVVDLAPGLRNDVPYLAFPVRTSDIDFTVTPGRGYFVGANAMAWMFFEDGDGQLDAGDTFVTVHLDVDLAAGTARPVAMLAGAAGSPGIVISTNEFTEFSFSVDAPVVGGPGALRGHVAAVPMFLELIFLPSQPSAPGTPDIGPGLEQRLWANGLVLDFDVPLFND